MDAAFAQTAVAALWILAGVVTIVARTRVPNRDLVALSGIFQILWGLSLGLAVLDIIDVDILSLFIAGSLVPLSVGAVSVAVIWRHDDEL